MDIELDEPAPGILRGRRNEELTEIKKDLKTKLIKEFEKPREERSGKKEKGKDEPF